MPTKNTQAVLAITLILLALMSLQRVGRPGFAASNAATGNALERANGADQAPVTPTPIIGYADLHVHQFAYEGFGGQLMVGKAFGPIEDALKSCEDLSCLHDRWYPFSVVKILEATGIGGITESNHGESGFPNFTDWPSWKSVTHQGVHQVMLKRAWQGGLRLIVMQAVNSERMCEKHDLTTSNGNPIDTLVCREKNPSIEGRNCLDYPNFVRQVQAAKDMEEYVERWDGGWYRIVTSPREAREVIAQGKLAVVLGIEGSDILNDTLADGSQIRLDDGVVLEKLYEYEELGIRHIFPIHQNDNSLGGAAFFKAPPQESDYLVNPRNPSQLLPAGYFLWPYSQAVLYDRFILEDCTREGYNFPVAGAIFPSGPTHSATGACNTRGLTDQGRLFLRAMMSRSIIIDVDHMSRTTRNETFNLVDQYRYPVTASHVGFLDLALGKHRHEQNQTLAHVRNISKHDGIMGLSFQGGPSEIDTYRNRTGKHGTTVIEHRCGRSAESFAQSYLYAIDHTDGSPVAFGTDINAFGPLPGPRALIEKKAGTVTYYECPGGGSPAPNTPQVQYPFTAIATGVQLHRDRLGNRTFDINTDGFAHIGMMPDFVEELRVMGITDEELQPLLHSAEGYIRMWESAEEAAKSIPPEHRSCRALREELRRLRQPNVIPPRALPTWPRQVRVACRMRTLGCWVDYVEQGTDCSDVPGEPHVNARLTNSHATGQDVLDEGAAGDFAGVVTDHNRFGPYTGVWSWGDQATTTFSKPIDNVTLPDGSRQSFVEFERRDQHAWADDGAFDVSLEVTDAFSGTGKDILAVTVNNVAPVAGNIAIDKTETWPGTVVNLSATFSDPGWLDTHTVSVDWGDESQTPNARVVETNNPPRAEGTITEEHKYAVPGRHIVRVTVTDDDGGTMTVTTTVHVRLSPEMPGMVKVDKEANFLQWTVGDAFSESAAEFAWRTGAGAAKTWWLYQDGDWLYVFRTHPGDVPTYNGAQPTIQRLNFLAYAVPVHAFQRWFWCGTVVGCHPRYGPIPYGAGQWHPWVVKRMADSRSHIFAELRRLFG